jgi:adenylate cyclase, class 2
MNETEIKILIKNSAEYPQHLTAAGFQEKTPRVFESNVVFDTEDFRLRQSDQLLRLRYTPAKSTLTWKGKSTPGRHKSRPELESIVSEHANVAQIFTELGFAPRFRYEKFRTEFEREPGGIVTFDETPIGHYLELEGEPAWIDKTASELGFSTVDYILESYGQLYRKFCDREGIPPTNMVFSGR